jgi:hypothetical protein
MCGLARAAACEKWVDVYAWILKQSYVLNQQPYKNQYYAWHTLAQQTACQN